jgi:high-affinity Fe2+/Pb2+ permease
MNIFTTFTLGFAAAILLVWMIFWVAKQDT